MHSFCIKNVQKRFFKHTRTKNTQKTQDYLLFDYFDPLFALGVLSLSENLQSGVEFNSGRDKNQINQSG